ncbi:hypothetical protein [Duganella sp. Leaf126]|uniref:hypothetical protein n=1 Tax=Duganella sp. Leaf126 TaxID=1736266 RepID=UPI000A77CF6B|nr:hypothetical protein [Duganella sp. Leaf126]
MGFDLQTLLQQHAGHVTAADPDGVAQAFKHIVGEHPPPTVASGIAHALLSDQTPAFSQIVSQLFLRSDTGLRTELLNLLLDNVSPTMLSALAGSVGALFTENGHPHLSAEQIADITPPQVAEIAVVAQQHNVGIVERVAALFARHAEVFNGLDSSILKVALGAMAQQH